MLHRILVRLARLAISEVMKKIISSLFVLASLALLVAIFIFNWHGFHSWVITATVVGVLPLLMFWYFLRRYLIIHPLAGNKKYDNYFISVFSHFSQSQSSWRRSDFHWISDSFSEVAPFSVFKLVPSKPGGKLFQNIAIYDLPLGDTLPSVFPYQVMLQVNFSNPYCREEVLRLMMDVWKNNGVLYSSYEDYLRQFFQDFLLIATPRLKKNFFSPEDIEVASYSKAVEGLEIFFSSGFKPLILSNVDSISYSFSSKD